MRLSGNNLTTSDSRLAAIPEANSVTTIDSDNPATLERLMTGALLLAIELERKEAIILELSNLIDSNNLKGKCEELLNENGRLTERVRTLTVQVQSTQSMEAQLHQRNIVSQLQDRLSQLEARLKIVQDQKLNALHEASTYKTEAELMSYKLLQLETLDKPRLREAQRDLAETRSKLESQQLLSRQLDNKLTVLRHELQINQQKEARMISSFHDEIAHLKQEIHFESVRYTEMKATHLRSSHVSDHSIQQSSKLREQLQYLRNYIREMQTEINVKNGDLHTVAEERTMLTGKVEEFKTKFNRLEGQMKDAKREISSFSQQLIEAHQKCTRLETIQRVNEDESHNLQRQVARLKASRNDLEAQVDEGSSEIRRLKRQLSQRTSDCQNCRQRFSRSVLSETTMPSSSLDLTQIINRAQDLKASSSKIQLLLSQTEAVLQTSIRSRGDLSLIENSRWS